MKLSSFVLLLAIFLIGGCEEEKRWSTTEGSARVVCDESISPVMAVEAEEFHRTYPAATISMRSADAREAIVNFVNDSVRVIVTGRPFNREERDILARAKIEFEEYKVALDAVAIIGHRDNPVKRLRLTQLDSIFSGAMTHWPGKNGRVIDVVIGGVNSSTREMFQERVLSGKPFTRSATPINSSEEIVRYVQATESAIGFVGLGWLRGHEQQLTVFGLGTPGERPDTTEPFGRYYAPVQAHVYRKYYPLTRIVYMYNREIHKDVGVGFIAYVASVPGQKVFLNNGLVPATMPVRLVDITSHEVK